MSAGSEPVPGTVWRHFKGGTYEVLHIALVEATLERVVVYRSLATNDVWTRPVTVWLEEVGPGVKRFAPIP